MGAIVCVAVSGPIAVGKSTLVSALATGAGAAVLYTPDRILKRSALSMPRDQIATRGDALARASGGAWLADEAQADLLDAPVVAIDAIRRRLEIEGLRRAFACTCLHVFLDASMEALTNRYESRARAEGQQPAIPYDAVARHVSEAQLPWLRAASDIVIDTTDKQSAVVSATVMERMRHGAS